MFRPLATSLLAATLVAVAGFAWSMREPGADIAKGPQAPADYAAAPGGSFTLVDHTGSIVTDKSFRGKYLLVFFGYTYCPDICPTTLNEITNALEVLGSRADRVQPLFITIDPERDTPDVVAEYVGAFHRNIVGLTGTPDQIRQVAGTYKAFYDKQDEGGADENGNDYFMDHSAFTYLMAPDGSYLTIFGFGTAPEDIAAEVNRRLDGKT